MLKKVQFLLMSKVLPPVLYIFLVLLKSTLRIEYINKPPHETSPDNTGFIICFWHARLLMMPFAKKWGSVKVLISRHRDGEFIARAIQFFKVGTIRGSYKKISLSSLREIIGNLRAGVDIAITPDGPKGPRYKIKSGVIDLSRLSGKVIVPVSYGASKKKLFNHGTDLYSPTLFRRLFFSGENPSLFLVT